MDSVKTDNEGELTSTMGNVLSMSSKDEKNDTSDATPTSSTDANTTTTSSQIVSDDPISSTSSEVEQHKSKSTEANMQNSSEISGMGSDELDKSSVDPEVDLLDISNVSNEKITEDVEDLVHDLESLLGESTDSFNIPIKRKEERRPPAVEEKRNRAQTSSEGQTSSSDPAISTVNKDSNAKRKENVVEQESSIDKPLENVHETAEVKACSLEPLDESTKETASNENCPNDAESANLEGVPLGSDGPVEPEPSVETTDLAEKDDCEVIVKAKEESGEDIIENVNLNVVKHTERVDESASLKQDTPIEGDDFKETVELTQHLNEESVSPVADASGDDNLQEVELDKDIAGVSEDKSILGDIKTETTIDTEDNTTDATPKNNEEMKIEQIVEELPIEDLSQEINIHRKGNDDHNIQDVNSEVFSNAPLNVDITSKDEEISISDTHQHKDTDRTITANDEFKTESEAETEAEPESAASSNIGPEEPDNDEEQIKATAESVIEDLGKEAEALVENIEIVSNTTEQESQLNIPEPEVATVSENIETELDFPNDTAESSEVTDLEVEAPISSTADGALHPQSAEETITSNDEPLESSINTLIELDVPENETTTDTMESVVTNVPVNVTETDTKSEKDESTIEEPIPKLDEEEETVEEPVLEISEDISHIENISLPSNEISESNKDDSVPTTFEIEADMPVVEDTVGQIAPVTESEDILESETISLIAEEIPQPEAPLDELQIVADNKDHEGTVAEVTEPDAEQLAEHELESSQPQEGESKIGEDTIAVVENENEPLVLSESDPIEMENIQDEPNTSQNEEVSKDTSKLVSEDIISSDITQILHDQIEVPLDEISAPIEETPVPLENLVSELVNEPSKPTAEVLQPCEDLPPVDKCDDLTEHLRCMSQPGCSAESTENHSLPTPDSSKEFDDSADLGINNDKEPSREVIQDIPEVPKEETKEDDTKLVDPSSKLAVVESECIQMSSIADSDSEEMVPVLALEPDDIVPSPQDTIEETCDVIDDLPVESHANIADVAEVSQDLPEIEEILEDQNQMDETAAVDIPDNLETILAVANLQNADSTNIIKEVPVEPEMSEKERREMEALRKAVESITETPSTLYEDDMTDVVEELIQINDNTPIAGVVMDSVTVNNTEILVEETVLDLEKETLPVEIEQNEAEVSGYNVTEQSSIEPAEESKEIVTTRQEVSETETYVTGSFQSQPDTSENKVTIIQTRHQRILEAVADSSQVNMLYEEAKQSETKEKETKLRGSERSKRHKKSSADNKLEELSINVDVPDREKPYSPKITIKPIKVPDEEVSTTSNSDSEIGKGCLKMTITKQSDKMHSILKICDPETSEFMQEQDEPIPKLIIKPKMQQVEQQHSPKMSTRSCKQVYSPTSSTQRSGSPRITIKPVVKPEKAESISPLKIKIKPEESSKKHSPKLNIKPVTKPEEESLRENIQSPRKVIIKPVIKPVEEIEQVHSPRITIKPIPKPDTEKEPVPRLNIKPIKKQEEDDCDVDRERSSPKIIIKPVIKPQEPDTQSADVEEEVKERIVLKINKGNLPTPNKDSKKREHPPEDDKSEKLAKITVKFSKGGGHPHIVQQTDDFNKRAHEDQFTPEKAKKQKLDLDSPISTRSKHKQEIESSVETRSKQYIAVENPSSESTKTKHENPGHESSRSKHKDNFESASEAKRTKRDTGPETPIYESTRSRHKESANEALLARSDSNDDIKIVETKMDSPIVISEDSRSQDSGSCVIIEEPKDPLSDIPIFEIHVNPSSAGEGIDSTSTNKEIVSAPPPVPPAPTPRKRGRPRKVPIVITEEQFKQQEEASKPQPPKEGEPPVVHDSGRPKRSCRGQSARATLGIKPRKPRGPGRGRGSKRGMGNRAESMKPEGEPKLSKAKLKLIQASLKQELAKASIEFPERDVFSSDVEIKPPVPVFPPPDIPSEIPTSPSTLHPVPSPHANVASPALLAIASPRSANPLAVTDLSIGADSVTSIASTSRAEPAEIVMVDEETRMSADTNSRAQTPAKQVAPGDTVIEESQSSVQSTATTESGKALPSRPNKTPRLEVQEPEGAVISADQLTEYYWNGNGPFMLQEQVAQFLGIKSFKRKYPGITRRMLEMQERDFIRESGLASEHMCDLGLTAVNSADILDIMYSDFQEKYEEYCKHQRDRQAKELINKQRALTLAASQEKNKADITEQAVQSAAQWNASFNKTRKEQRKACMDLQTLTVHYPKGKIKQINKAKVGNYPIALVPGQFTDYYKEFTPTEINNLPINTICYDPINIIPPEESDDSGSDGSDSESDSSSSSSGSGSDSSSGVEDCKLCKHTPKKGTPSK